MIKERPKTTGSLKLAIIRIDGGTQMRADLNEDVVAEYAQIVKDGGDFPPVVVYFDGSKYWLADGFHRFHAYRAALAEEIPADVRTGQRRDAILHSVSANASHGLRRTSADKRRAVETLLNDKEWSAWPQTKIAEACGVSQPFVSRVASEVASYAVNKMRKVERNGTSYQQNTANIGKAKSPDTSAPAEADATVAATESAADTMPVADPKAEEQAQKVENDRFREANVAALPEHIREVRAAREAAIAKRRETAGTADGDGLTDEQRVLELREHIKVVEAENDELRADNAKFEKMRVQWEQGGFEKVIAGKDEELRVAHEQFALENADKATWMGKARFWEKEAKRLGWKKDVVIVGSEGLRDA